MSDYLSTELTATCGALGYYDGHKYHLDKYCLDVIKDLIKYLRRDDDSHTVRQFLGQTKILQTDLIKIFIDHSDKLELWDVLLRLIINLTSPVLLLYNEQIPTDKMQHSIYQKLIFYTQEYKVAFIDDRIWTTLSNRLSKILKLDTMERGEEKEMMIERILIFIRNVLQVPPDENENRVDNDVTVHDEVLFALNASGVVDLLLFIASNQSEKQYHLQVLEIVSLMLGDQSPSQLATSGLQRSTTEKEKDEAVLLAARQKEKLEKMEKIRKYAGARHSHFGGTYVVQNMKAIGENQLLCHKPFQKIEALNFGRTKTRYATPKNKRPMSDPKGERTSTLSVRLFLKEFCVEFLNAAYNPVMKYARSCIVANQSEHSETICYLWTLRFFMEFNRHYKFEVKYVSETISTEMFHFTQRQMEQYQEMMLMDRKKIPLWSRRLHVALKAYKELLHTLMAMDQSADRGVRESSKVIKSNVFYVPEYRETILTQFLSFDEVKMSRQYLVDLITTVHIFLKMLSIYCGRSNRSVLVQKKAHKHKRSGKKKTVQKEQPPPRTMEERWDEVSPQLSVVMREGAIPEVVPFDAASDVPIEDQKVEAMKKIQKLLRTKFLEQAIGLIRASREVWPENDCFGRADITSEEEFLALREIFFADLGVEDEPVTQNEDQEENAEHDEDEEEDEEEEDERRTVMVEANFNFTEFIQRFANIKIVKALRILLQQFDKNTDEVNHYVNKMLHRIAWDCKMPGMMFQASMFRVFQRILDSKYPGHKELQKFAIFIIRRFIEVAQKNRKAYMELLFWKTTRDATEVVEGYNAETDNKKVSRSLWTEAQEDELRTLFMEHQTNKYSQDLVDWLLENITQERTRRGIIKKLKEMCLIVNSKNVRSEIQKRLPKEWSEEEVAQLSELWELRKEDDDPVDMIFNGLTIKRPKPKIKEKLLELGLAADRKELRKKRSRKSNHGKSSWETQSVSNSDENESSDEEAGKSPGPSRKAPNKPTNRKTKTGRKKEPTVVYTDAQLSGFLKDVIEKNMNEALEWIKESLQDILDDRDEESTEGIPLVPLTDYSSAAMDSPSFQKLLRAMGFTPPFDEQESYWRIPANMLTPSIQKRCDLIESALAGNFIAEEPGPFRRKVTLELDRINESDDDVDALENIKKYFASREPGPSVSLDSESDDEAKKKPKSSKATMLPKKSAQRMKVESDKSDDEVENEPNSPKPAMLPRKSAQRIEVESDESDDEVKEKPKSPKITKLRKESVQRMEVESDEEKVASPPPVETSENSRMVKPKQNNRVKVLVDSSDSEHEEKTNLEDAEDEGKRDRSDGSENEHGTTKKRRLLDSDEEEEPLPSLNTELKHAKLIISDEEDETIEKQPTRVGSSRAIISDDDDD
ncbi:circadian regulator timeout [Nomia melanderi]|uniref:circadian regulator timeout n=1 Tax=Nomia melanderi TaxID=2448451 RepID=UPI0013045329|nr:protein timeless homolog [Nomia melanderi]